MSKQEKPQTKNSKHRNDIIEAGRACISYSFDLPWKTPMHEPHKIIWTWNSRNHKFMYLRICFLIFCSDWNYQFLIYLYKESTLFIVGMV